MKRNGAWERGCGRRSGVKLVHSPARYRIGTGEVKSITCSGGSSNISFPATFFSTEARLAGVSVNHSQRKKSPNYAYKDTAL